MAGRLRVLTDRCIFCTFNATKSFPVFTQRLPGTVRFRSSRTKPPLHVLAEYRQRSKDNQGKGVGKAITTGQLYSITDTLLKKIAPPPLDEGENKYYTDANSSQNDWYNGLSLPAKVLQKQFRNFHNEILLGLKKADFGPISTFITSKAEIESAIHERGGLGAYLTQKFLSYINPTSSPVSSEEEKQLKKAADLRFPQEWYPIARQCQRTWYLHVGPTNSGKTYQALQRLMQSNSGCYAGPLRLLAHEVFERMNAQGIPCNLITGDDRKIVSDTAQLTSSTVEMVDLGKSMDVCVLDEIQMIGDEDRGWAWTQALMGVKAKEVHLCGEERTVELIKNLAATMGDKLIVQHYKRLGPLEVMKQSLDGDLTKLEKGDCIVTFSRKNIFGLQKEIESQTGKKCAIIYGGLPPETRSIQAQLFNNPDNDYEILIASDAVGMGLNLSVKRIIFETTVKFNGTTTVPVSIPAIKQIAGRAGRFRVAGAKTPVISADDTVAPLPAAPSVGLVTTLDKVDYSPLKYAMSVTPKPLKTAGIMATGNHIEEFSTLFPPTTPFHVVLQKLRDYAATNRSLFHLCSFEDHVTVAKAISGIKGLSVSERLQFCMAPISRDPAVQDAALDMAQILADNGDGSALNIKSFDLDVLDIENPTMAGELRRLEGLHKSLLLYLWLSWRFPATFTPRETAQDLKAICEEKIDLALKNIKITRKKHNIGVEEQLAAIRKNVVETVHRGAERYDDGDEDMFDIDKEEEGESVIPHMQDEDLVPSPEIGDMGFVPDTKGAHKLSGQMGGNL